MAIIIIVGIVLLVFGLGILLAVLFSGVDRMVTNTKTEMVLEEQSYNPAVTMGHRVQVQADYEDQLAQARREAAKRAAALPRGGNLNIGRDGRSTLQPASQNLVNDPLSTVRIAQFHGWDGARTGIPAGGVAVAAPAAATAVAIASPTLIEITDDMSPDDVRKARIANAKAESAYKKALKEAGETAAATAGAAVAAPAAAAVAVPPPTLIEITDDMSPDDVRKARIANAKAESAYKKALKEAGATAAAAPAVQAAPAAAPAATPAFVAVEPPTLIEITDGMSPDDVRKARIANAKAESAYKKALKEAGAAAPAAAATASTAPVSPEPAAAAAAPVPAVTPAAAGIEPPSLIEISDAMSPEEIRSARVSNAKAMSAYNKALKAAGIDPASVK